MREFRQGNIRFTDMIAGRNNNTYFNGRKIPNHFKGGCNICSKYSANPLDPTKLILTT